MKTLKLKFANGEVVELGVPDDADSCCPICGEAFYGYVPYHQTDQGTHTGSYDTCPVCAFVYGYSDSVGADGPPGCVEEVWKDFRVRWLNRKGWANKYVEQLKANLGIDVEKLKRENGR